MDRIIHTNEEDLPGCTEKRTLNTIISRKPNPYGGRSMDVPIYRIQPKSRTTLSLSYEERRIVLYRQREGFWHAGRTQVVQEYVSSRENRGITVTLRNGNACVSGF
jgi:hypothetical protein